MAGRIWVFVTVTLLSAGCSATQLNPPVGTPSPLMACPVTRPVPPETIPAAAAQPIVSGYQGPPGGLRLSMYGNDSLWVVLPTDPDGVMRVTRDADGLSAKFPWVRLTQGRLTIVARRLDGPAPPARASIPDGYGMTGFQASGITFPTEGCWEITGSIASQQLQFIVDVRRAP